MKKINSKPIIIAIAMLFFLIIGLATSCKKTTCNYAPCTVRDSINISTGRGDTGTVDANWITTAVPATSANIPIIMPAWPGYEVTPIAGTNAGWINCSGRAYNPTFNINGNYTYETSFAITNNTMSFSCDFSTAYDDALISLELVDPSGTSFPQLDPPHLPNVAHLNANVGTVITNPMVGIWKIRATIRTADNGTGLLVSGYIKTIKPC